MQEPIKRQSASPAMHGGAKQSEVPGGAGDLSKAGGDALADERGFLTFAELEGLYDELAKAIDLVGPGDDAVFLAKLLLALAREFGNADRISVLIQECLQEPAIERRPGQPLL